ncbi:MAG: CHAT domain-containing protein [Terriglobales bacterium]
MPRPAVPHSAAEAPRRGRPRALRPAPPRAGRGHPASSEAAAAEAASAAAALEAEVAALLRVDLPRAAELAQQAAALARRRPDAAHRAFALRAQGNVLWFQGQHRPAAVAHARAARLFAVAGLPLEQARTLSSSIQPLILAGAYARARAAGRRAKQIFQAQRDPMRLARLEINLGNIDHRRDRFRPALLHYQHAYEQLLALGPQSAGDGERTLDVEGVIAALHNIAMCSIVVNDYARARQAHAQARELCLRHHLPRGVIQADYNIAYLHYFRGDYARAIEMLSAARRAAQEINDPYLAALCPLDLAEIYVELHLAGEAAELAADAQRRFSELGMGYEAAKALASQAIALCQQGQALTATEMFTRARAAFVREANQSWPAMMDLYRAIAFFREERWFEARRDARAALRAFGRSPLPGRALSCRLLLAQLDLQAGDLAAARRQAAAAQAAITGREPPLLRQQAHQTLGEIAERGGHPLAAAQHYLAGQKILESLRGAIHGEELKISFLRQRLAVYEHFAGLCADPEAAAALGPLGDPGELAWHAIEQAKSRALRDRLAAPAPTPPPSAHASRSPLVARIRALREELHWYHHRLQAEQMAPHPAPARLAALQAAAEQRERQFLRALRQLPPETAAGAGWAAPAAPLPQVQACLRPQTTLIEYFRVRDRLYAAIVPPAGRLELVPLTVASRVGRELQGLRLQLSKFRLGPAYAAQFAAPLLRATQAHLASLYHELIAPLRPRLHTPRLLIVPHEQLHAVPFHALYDGNAYLLDTFICSYAPSATLYARATAGAAPAGPPVIFGIADEHNPAIAAEAQAIAQGLPEAELRLDAAATRAELQRLGAGSRWIHIATHGVFRRDNPLFSSIRLGDGDLNLYDLEALRLPAELITLSGCSTGLATTDGGDEQMGLARGLLAAGGRNLLLTLWDVQDGSTAQFMPAFYGRLARGASPAEALQATMRQLRDSYAHPFYWAPFQLIATQAGA